MPEEEVAAKPPPEKLKSLDLGNETLKQLIGEFGKDLVKMSDSLSKNCDTPFSVSPRTLRYLISQDEELERLFSEAEKARFEKKEEWKEKVLEMIQQNPGINPTAVRKALMIPERLFPKVLSALDEQGLIERRRVGQGEKLYPEGKVPELCLTAVQEEILKIVRKEPGLNLTEIGARAEDKSVAHNLLRNVRILNEQHLVYTKKIGMKRICLSPNRRLASRRRTIHREKRKRNYIFDR